MVVRRLVNWGFVLLALGCSSSAGSSTDGAELFERNCARCHAMNGKGDAVTKRRLPVPDMTSDEFQDELTPEHLKETVRRGSKKLDMPAFGESYFTEEQLDALVVHVRGFKGE